MSPGLGAPLFLVRMALAIILLPFSWCTVTPWFLGVDPIVNDAVQGSSLWAAIAVIIVFLGLCAWRTRPRRSAISPYFLARDFAALVLIASLLRWACQRDALAVTRDDGLALLSMHVALGIAFTIPIYILAKKLTLFFPSNKQTGRPRMTTAFVLNAASISLIIAVLFGVGLPSHYQSQRDLQTFKRKQSLAEHLVRMVSGQGMEAMDTRLHSEARRLGIGTVVLTQPDEQPAFMKNAAYAKRMTDYYFVVANNGERFRAWKHALVHRTAWFKVATGVSPPIKDRRASGPVVILILMLIAAPCATWLVAGDLAQDCTQITHALGHLGEGSARWTEKPSTSNEPRRAPGVAIWRNDELGDLAVDLNQACAWFEQTNQDLIDGLRYTASQERAQAQFLTSASHMLSAPTHRIVTMCDTLHTTNLSKALFDDVKAIQDATNKLAQRLNDMALLANLDDWRQLPFEMETFEFIPFTATVFETLSTLAPSHLVLEFSSSQSSPKIYGDKTRIRQILENMIGNAIKFTEAGFVRVQVDESHFSDGTPAVRLQVWDSGPGIKASELEAIFAEFYRSQAHRNVPGSGIGLAIAKRLVERHSGQLSVHSRLGEGSIFSCLFPKVEG
ncbi:MAG: HAMP domain-containing sensor histidine kinase [Myxococcota bacterium]|nr:HAMP domain-containing sensor histidine kinase [Myxococcota bacterium]